MAAFYAIRTWIIGWFSRLVVQVVFFGLFGLLFRLLLAGGSYATAFADIAAELAVGACWFVIALFVMRLSVHEGRKNGTLELSAG
jgi:hypothetical protein